MRLFTDGSSLVVTVDPMGVVMGLSLSGDANSTVTEL